MKYSSFRLIILFNLSIIAASAQDIITINLIANKLMFDPGRDKIFALVNGRDSLYGNSLVQINPWSGTIERSLFVGSEPTSMDMTKDSDFVYIGLDGASFVKRVNLDSFIVDRNINLGGDINGPYIATDVTASNLSNELVVVSRRYASLQTNYNATAVYFYGTPLSQVINSSTLQNRELESEPDSNIIFGYDNGASSYGFSRMFIDTINGLNLIDVTNSLSMGQKIELHNHLIYSNRGKVLDPYLSTPTFIGTFSNLPFGVDIAVEPDYQNNKTYFAAFSGGTKIYSYKLQQYSFIDETSIPLALTGLTLPKVTDIIRFHDRGLAFTIYNDYSNNYQGRVILLNSCIPFGAADLSLAADSTEYEAYVSDTIAIQFYLTNLGDSAAANVQLLDTFPTSTQIISTHSASGIINSVGNIIEWQIPSLVPGQIDTASVFLQVLSQDNNRHKAFASASTFECNDQNDTISYKFDFKCRVNSSAYFSYHDSGLVVRFNCQDFNNINWQWDFGDSTIDSVKAPEHIFSHPGTYYVCVTSNNGCDDDTYCHFVFVESIGIEELNISGLSFSNPVIDNLAIQYDLSRTSEISLKVIDNNGRNLIEKKLTSSIGNNRLSIDMSGINPGIYFLNLLIDDRQLWKKIVKL